MPIVSVPFRVTKTLEPFLSVSAKACCFRIFWRFALAALACDLVSGGADAGAGDAAAAFFSARAAATTSSSSSRPGGPESSESSESYESESEFLP